MSTSGQYFTSCFIAMLCFIYTISINCCKSGYIHNVLILLFLPNRKLYREFIKPGKISPVTYRYIWKPFVENS